MQPRIRGDPVREPLGFISPFFADDVVWLAPLRESTSPSLSSLLLTRKKVHCPLEDIGELLSEFKDIAILFIIEGKKEHDIDRRIGAAATVRQPLYQSVVVKTELS